MWKAPVFLVLDSDGFCFSLCLLVRPKRTLYSKKYGVDLIRYTHAANTVVYSSNKIDGKQAFLGAHGHGSFEMLNRIFVRICALVIVDLNIFL